MTELKLYNSLTRTKETFEPIDPANVRMYVCGPTVYDRPHIGNARAVVVYDVLFRLLKHIYGEDNVTYARNITDVDDKINAAAKANGEPISALTERVTGWFHSDMDALGNERPTVEPRATQEIAPIIALIEKIIANGCAYESEGEVLFEVGKVGQLDDYSYGKLSGKKLEDLIAGARIEAKGHKRSPGDFVLWKPALPGDDPSSVFDSPWGKGRPGWHIECSAMSSKYLGDDFDIHGGGADLKFPHHENEIAQSRCANKHSHFAKLWVHNGFVTVNGEKMSKSLGNFITVKDLLDKGIKGEVIRYALLSAKYNEPLDWTEAKLEQSRRELLVYYKALAFAQSQPHYEDYLISKPYDIAAFQSLTNDLNTPEAFAHLYALATQILTAYNNHERWLDWVKDLRFYAHILGIIQHDPEEWFRGGSDEYKAKINALVEARTAAKKAKNFAEADRIRNELAAQGIILEDSPQGTTWRKA